MTESLEGQRKPPGGSGIYAETGRRGEEVAVGREQTSASKETYRVPVRLAAGNDVPFTRVGTLHNMECGSQLLSNSNLYLCPILFPCPCLLITHWS